MGPSPSQRETLGRARTSVCSASSHCTHRNTARCSCCVCRCCRCCCCCCCCCCCTTCSRHVLENAERTQKEVERCISTVHCRTPLRLYAMYDLEMATIQLSLSVEVRNRLACHLSIVPRSDFHCTKKRFPLYQGAMSTSPINQTG